MKAWKITILMSILGVSAYATDLSGKYKCDLYDKADGAFKSSLGLKLNKSASKLDQGYASYDVEFNVVGIPYPYVGIAASHGNDIAIYFESAGSKKNPDDRGVGIASVVVDQDAKGKDIVSLHKFYYEKSYKGSSDVGFENCIKTN